MTRKTLRHIGNTVKNCGLERCEEVLGKKRVNHKEWISEDTIQKIEARKEKRNILNLSRTRNAKAKAQNEYAAADKEVKASVKKDKKNFVEELAGQAGEAAGQGNLKDLYMQKQKTQWEVPAVNHADKRYRRPNADDNRTATKPMGRTFH